MKVKNIFAERNRGMLLDIVVLVVNLVLMNLLTAYFADLIRLANEEDPLAKFVLGLCLLGMLVLPATGAVLKRWHFHKRREAQQRGKGKTTAPVVPFELESGLAAGCLFNPIFYFCVSLVTSAAAGALLSSVLFGDELQKNGALFISMMVGSLALCVLQTILVYRYFLPPKKAPESAFRRDPRSELAADVCIFLNMILFQIMWNLVSRMSLGPVTGFGDFMGRLFFLSFVALLIYFPPRIFYLAEDIHRPAVWCTMLLANSPAIFRILIGTKSGTVN